MIYYSRKNCRYSITNMNGRLYLNVLDSKGKVIQSGHIIEDEAKKIIKAYQLKEK